MSKKKVTIIQTVNEMLGLDAEQYAKILHVTVSGTNAVLVQGFERVCEYNDRCASFIKGAVLCEICGDDLSMFGLTQDTARITGSIASVTYSEVGR